MQQHTLLIASADDSLRDVLAQQLDADGHAVFEADIALGAVAKLATQAIDVAILADLEHPPDAGALLRDIRAGRAYPRIHPAQPIITLGATDDLTTLLAYENGSDHHLATDTSYLILRAAIAALTRRARADGVSRHLHVGELHIDTAARTADIDGVPVKLTGTGYALLSTMAADPQRLFTKDELRRVVWGDTMPTGSRALDSQIGHLRHRLADAGADIISNIWGQGWRLTPRR